MPNALAVRSLLPETIPSLPRPLAALAALVGTVEHRNQPTRYNLPRGVTMTEEERRSATAILTQLNDALLPDAPFEVEGEVRPGPMAKGALLATLITGLAGKERSEFVATCEMDLYARAVEDVPAWAIDRAMGMWSKGECPRSIEKEPAYKWPPSPATLHQMALWYMDIPRGDVARLEKLLAALPFERAMDPEPLPGPVTGSLRRM